MKCIHKLIIAQILITSTLQVYYVRKICFTADNLREKITLCNRGNEEKFDSIRTKIDYLKELINRNKSHIDTLILHGEVHDEGSERIDSLHQTVKEINIRIKGK